ncbi:MAG: tetratricopeptide repeat protein, partial [Planctomycetota bacterium]
MRIEAVLSQLLQEPIRPVRQGVCGAGSRGARFGGNLRLGHGRLCACRHEVTRRHRIRVARIRLAELDAEAGRWAAANRHVDAALRLQPDDPHALWLKARIAMKLGRWADAEELLQRAAERLPQH